MPLLVSFKQSCLFSSWSSDPFFCLVTVWMWIFHQQGESLLLDRMIERWVNYIRVFSPWQFVRQGDISVVSSVLFEGLSCMHQLWIPYGSRWDSSIVKLCLKMCFTWTSCWAYKFDAWYWQENWHEIQIRIFPYNGGHSKEVYHTKRMQR